jgi:hypothetical protein
VIWACSKCRLPAFRVNNDQAWGRDGGALIDRDPRGGEVLVFRGLGSVQHRKGVDFVDVLTAKNTHFCHVN